MRRGSQKTGMQTGRNEPASRHRGGWEGKGGEGEGLGGRWQRGDLLLFFYCFVVVVARRFYNI